MTARPSADPGFHGLFTSGTTVPGVGSAAVPGADAAADAERALRGVDNFFSALEGVDPATAGFTHLDPEAARAQAGSAHGDLAGLVVPVKDLNNVAGMPTGLGSTLRVHLPEADDPVVRMLRRRGAVTRRARIAGLYRHAWGVDALLTPTLAYDPPALGAFSRLSPPDDFDAQTAWTPWGSLFNLTGGAAVSVPVDAARPLPASVQIGSFTLSDAAVLALAAQVTP
ncbi:amidase family protein [Corynebacterium frankenforstense]